MEALLQKQMFDEAFLLILRHVQQSQLKDADLNNDSMMLIKALGKVGCKFPLRLPVFDFCLLQPSS